MAKLTKIAVFWRVFLLSLLVGVPAGSKKVLADEASDWARASGIGTKEAIIWYLRRHPAGDHIDEAIGVLSDIREDAAPLTRDISVY